MYLQPSCSGLRGDVPRRGGVEGGGTGGHQGCREICTGTVHSKKLAGFTYIYCTTR